MKLFSKIKSIFYKTEKTTEIKNIYNYPPNSYMRYMSSQYGSGAKYRSGMSRSPNINIHDHFSLRQYARDEMYDSIFARSIVERYADTVVDRGLFLKPTPEAEILGITSEQAEEWAEKVAKRFHLWAKSKKSDRSRINNFYQNQYLYHFFQQRDNDMFVRFFYGREKDLINSLQIKMFEPNQIRGYDYTTNYMQYDCDDGIIKNDTGREIKYKIQYYKDGKYKYEDIPAVGEKSGRIFMIHGFRPEYAGQSRGYSRLAHMLQDFENLTDFKMSHIKKAIAQSSFIAAIENDQMDPSNPLEGKVAGPIREYGSFPEPSASAQNITNDALEPVVNWESMPEATFHEPGAALVGNLRRGDKMKYLQDTSPSASFDSFVNSFCSYLAASNGIPIEVVLMKFNANYSASRATLILFWRIAQIWRDEMIADFLTPVYEMWLSEEIASGRISAPGWTDTLMKEAWLCAEWAGSPMPNIDPLKSAQADEKFVELGAQTLDDVARNYNGSSGKANRMKNARQFSELPEPAWGWKNNSNGGDNSKETDNGDDE